MSQNERSKMRYALPRPSSLPTKRSDTRESLESYWKYIQRHHADVSPNRSYRQHLAEPTESYYSSTNSYKPPKHYCQNLLHAKYLTTENPELIRRCRQQPQARIHPNNIAIVTKPRYKRDVDEEENLKCTGEESGNFTEDNPDEDAVDEVDEEQEETAESADKDYEEQDTDEEVDEESDLCPDIRRIRRRIKETSIKPTSRLPIEHQSEDLRKLRYEKYLPVQKAYRGQLSKARYYRSAGNHEVPEALSEENIMSPPISRASSRKSPVNFHECNVANPLDKYQNAMPSTHATRRNRMRQELDSAIDQEIGLRKCTCCGSSSSKRPSSSKKSSCRFQDQLNFPVKGPTGDEIEISGKSYCGQCNLKQQLDKIPELCDKSKFYSLKPLRTKLPRSPVYESIEDRHVIDNVPTDHGKSRYSKDTMHEKTKHSVQNVHDSTRGSRYID